MSKSYDKIDGKKVREQYFRSERRKSKRKEGDGYCAKPDHWQKKWEEGFSL